MLCLLFQNEVSCCNCNRSPLGLRSHPYPAVIPLVCVRTDGGRASTLTADIALNCMRVSAAYRISLDCSGKAGMGRSAYTDCKLELRIY